MNGNYGPRTNNGEALCDAPLNPQVSYTRSSEEVGEVVAALTAVQAKLVPLERDQTRTNDRGEEYGYTSLAMCLATLLPLTAAQGLAVIQHTRRTPAGNIIVTTRLAKGEQWMEAESEWPVGNPNDVQQVAGAQTYARRYGLAFFGLVSVGDDQDGADARRRAPQAPGSATRAVPKGPKQVDGTRKRIVEALDAKGISREDTPRVVRAVAAAVGITDHQQATDEQLVEVCQKLEGMTRAEVDGLLGDAGKPKTPPPAKKQEPMNHG